MRRIVRRPLRLHEGDFSIRASANLVGWTRKNKRKLRADLSEAFLLIEEFFATGIS